MKSLILHGLMANQNDGRPVMNVLDWDAPDSHIDKCSSGQLAKRLKTTWNILCQKLDQKFPSQRRYCGCNRQLFLVLCGVCLLISVTLAIGLGIGLRRLSGQDILQGPSRIQILIAFVGVRIFLFPLNRRYTKAI